MNDGDSKEWQGQMDVTCGTNFTMQSLKANNELPAIRKKRKCR